MILYIPHLQFSISSVAVMLCVAKIIGTSNPSSSGGRYGAGASDIKWSPDQQYFAVGYSDG
jgi:hypothetical protein